MKWKEVNLFHNPLLLYVTEISLSGKNIRYRAEPAGRDKIHTPELTTLGASAKGWIRQQTLNQMKKPEILRSQQWEDVLRRAEA